MGPGNIASRRVAGSLVVMDGCHSGQGQTLPGSGLMGLTRAWIGAGASTVVSQVAVNAYKPTGDYPYFYKFENVWLG